MLLESQAQRGQALRDYYGKNFPDQPGVDEYLTAVSKKEAGVRTEAGRTSDILQGSRRRRQQFCRARWIVWLTKWLGFSHGIIFDYVLT